MQTAEDSWPITIKCGSSLVQFIRQPKGSTLCGHACVAMVADVTLDEAIEAVGHTRPTRTKDLKRALAALEVVHAPRRVRGMPKEGTALLFCKGDNGCHWIVWHKNKHYDPAAGVFKKLPRHVTEAGARVTSHLKVELNVT